MKVVPMLDRMTLVETLGIKVKPKHDPADIRILVDRRLVEMFGVRHLVGRPILVPERDYNLRGIQDILSKHDVVYPAVNFVQQKFQTVANVPDHYAFDENSGLYRLIYKAQKREMPLNPHFEEIL